MAFGGPRGAGAVERSYVIGSHDPGDTMFATALACFAQIEKTARGTVDVVTRRIGRADQAEQSLILSCSIGERFMQSFIQPTARHIAEPAHDCHIKLTTRRLDEGVLRSDPLRSVPIAHRFSSV